ncbi:hypothetical protein [Methanomicrobium mobile]|nr:hypothetical protein [Methanomicrobium mobile]
MVMNRQSYGRGVAAGSYTEKITGINGKKRDIIFDISKDCLKAKKKNRLY